MLLLLQLRMPTIFDLPGAQGPQRPAEGGGEGVVDADEGIDDDAAESADDDAEEEDDADEHDADL